MHFEEMKDGSPAGRVTAELLRNMVATSAELLRLTPQGEVATRSAETPWTHVRAIPARTVPAIVKRMASLSFCELNPREASLGQLRVALEHGQEAVFRVHGRPGAQGQTLLVHRLSETQRLRRVWDDGDPYLASEIQKAVAMPRGETARVTLVALAKRALEKQDTAELHALAALLEQSRERSPKAFFAAAAALLVACDRHRGTEDFRTLGLLRAAQALARARRGTEAEAQLALAVACGRALPTLDPTGISLFGEVADIYASLGELAREAEHRQTMRERALELVGPDDLELIALERERVLH